VIKRALMGQADHCPWSASISDQYPWKARVGHVDNSC